VRLSVTVVVLGGVAALFGGWLVGRWCLGVVLIAESVLAVWWGVFAHYDGAARAGPVAGAPPTLAQVLERARDAS
jgi:hypothetical protein